MHVHRRFIRSGVAPAVAVAALLTLAVSAPAQPTRTPPRQDLRLPDTRDAIEGRPSPREILTLVRIVPAPEANAEARGFHLRDAAIGAAATTGLMLLAAGAFLRLRRRSRQPYIVQFVQRSL